MLIQDKLFKIGGHKTTVLEQLFHSQKNAHMNILSYELKGWLKQH